MRFKNLFNIFLVLALVSVGVYFATGHVSSVGNTFTSPADANSVNVSYINGNQTLTITFNTTWQNVTFVNLYNITSLWVNGAYTYTALNMTHNQTLNNTDDHNYTSISFVLNTHNFTQGNYTFTALVINNSVVGGNANGTLGHGALSGDGSNATYVNLSVIIDNTPPYVLDLVYPINETFDGNNATIQFGFNVSDSMSGNHTWGNLINCTFMLDGAVSNSSIVAPNVTDLSPANPKGAVWTFNVTSTSIDSGFHTWNMTCYDNRNNFNSTARSKSHIVGVSYIGANFTISDTTGPTTATPTFSASSVTQNTAVTITCTGTDTITSNPKEYVSVRNPSGGDWQGDIGVSPYSYTGTGDVGTYTVRCRSTDSAGIFGSYSSEATFAVTKAASTSPTTTTTGPGGGPTTVSVNVLTGQTRDLGAIAEAGEGIINAYQASTVTFTVTTSSGGAVASSHSIKFDEVDYIKGTATVTISSDPIILTLNVGEIKNVDLDSDGTEDLEVNLVSIDENGKVNLKVKDMTGGAVITEEETTEEVTPTTAEEVKEGMSWIWWVLIIVVVVIIIALVLPKKK